MRETETKVGEECQQIRKLKAKALFTQDLYYLGRFSDL